MATEQELRQMRRMAHRMSRDPSAPLEDHDWEEITLPCTTLIRLTPSPILWHPLGHHGVRCRDCGVVMDSTLSGIDPINGVEGWGYET